MDRVGGASGVETADPGDTRPTVGTRLGIIAIGLASGAVAAAAGTDPVGDTLLSAVIVTVTVAVVCRIGSAAPRPVLAWMVLVAGISTAWLPGILAAAGVFTLVHLGRQFPLFAATSPRAATVSSALAGSAMVLASRSDLDQFLGASTVVGVLIGLVIVVAGLARSGRRDRLAVGLASLVVAISVVGASVGFGSRLLSVTEELNDAEQLVRDGLRQLGTADLRAAEASFRQASSQFEEADNRLRSPIGVGAAAVPVVAQHRSAATVLSSRAAAVTDRAADLLAGLGDDALSLVDARIDLDTIAAFDTTLEEIQDSLDMLDDDISRLSSPWLLQPAVDQLDDLRTEISQQRARAERAAGIIDVLPAMLGGDDERVYLLLFTTPAEARGLGGFTGNWAEITVDEGQVTVSDFGRASELDEASPAGTRTVSGPREWVERYGVYGFTNGPGRTVGADPFKNITMSPFMASTGEVVADLYPQSGGRAIDGVFVADVYVLAELLRFTGPVEVPGTNRRVNAGSAAEFLLNTQYTIPDKAQRIDSIAETSNVVVERLLGGSVTLAPSRLLRALGPMAEQGRLAAWATKPSEQALLDQIGLAGTMRPLATDDAMTIAFNNAAGNKIDYYLEATGRYEARVEPNGTVEGSIEVTLKNTAPSEGQPRYVIANAIDAPLGTNQTLLSIFTALPTSQLTVDGASVAGPMNLEGGYFVTDVLVLVPPGETRTVRLGVSGRFDAADGYSLLVRSPPAVGSTPIDIDLTVVDAGGARSISRTLEAAGVERIDIDFAGDGS